jgi:hypothetical protein
MKNKVFILCIYITFCISYKKLICGTVTNLLKWKQYCNIVELLKNRLLKLIKATINFTFILSYAMIWPLKARIIYILITCKDRCNNEFWIVECYIPRVNKLAQAIIFPTNKTCALCRLYIRWSLYEI